MIRYLLHSHNLKLISLGFLLFKYVGDFDNIKGFIILGLMQRETYFKVGRAIDF